MTTDDLLIGLRVEQANEFVKPLGNIVRVIKIDDEELWVLEDYNPNRINVHVRTDDGVQRITEINNYS